MRKIIAASFALFVGVFCFPAGAAGGADPLSTLRKEHPRLLFTAQDWSDFDLRVRNRAADPHFDRLIAQLEKNARALLDMPPVKRELIGRRLLNVSREALRRVLTLAVVYRATGEEAFFRRAEEELLAVAAFENWNPTHFLDVGEMTTAVALGYDWFYGKLSAETRASLRRAIAEKGLGEGIDATVKHNGWHRNENNWNQVCFAGLSLGALAIVEDEPELARAMLNVARAGIVRGLKPYAPDGVYPEGPVYWGYGTSFQVLLIAALESALGVDWGLCASPGFLASASVQTQLCGPTGAMYNFSDCRDARLFEPVLLWFAKKLGNPALAVPPGPPDGMGRLLPLAALWWPRDGVTAAPERGSTVPASSSESACSTFVPAPPLVWKGEGINPVAVFRSSWTDPDAMYLACKAGAANASHGHMDAGSFIFEADGVRWAIDLGMQDYESLDSKGIRLRDRGQNGARWSVFRLNNFSHNTLTIGGQLHRVEGRAEFVRFGDAGVIPGGSGKSSGTEIDLSPVFAGQATGVRRTFEFRPQAREVFIRDEIKGATPGAEIRWAMVTKAQVQVSRDESGSHARLSLNGKKLRAWTGNAHADGNAKTEMRKFEVIPADPPRDDFNAPNPDTRILIVRAKVPKSGDVSILVRLRVEAEEMAVARPASASSRSFLGLIPNRKRSLCATDEIN